MGHVALIGPEIEENLSLRYLARKDKREPGMAGATYVGGTPSVTGGTLVNANVVSDSATIELSPTSGRGQVTLDATCPKGPQTLSAIVTVSGPTEGGSDGGQALAVQPVDGN